MVDRVEAIAAETGQNGLHFVDEAAPPKSLKPRAAELHYRRVLDHLVGQHPLREDLHPRAVPAARRERLHRDFRASKPHPTACGLTKKGISVDQVTRVTRGFADAGIRVHAYLTCGFPRQTVHDAVDAPEYVRQLLAEGCIQSGFFHHVARTVHSPVASFLPTAA